MKTYGYLHQGLTDGLSATAGNTYSVIRTDKKIDNRTTGWLATNKTEVYKGKTFRWFVNTTSGVLLAFDDNDTFKQTFND